MFKVTKASDAHWGGASVRIHFELASKKGAKVEPDPGLPANLNLIVQVAPAGILTGSGSVMLSNRYKLSVFINIGDARFKLAEPFARISDIDHGESPFLKYGYLKAADMVMDFGGFPKTHTFRGHHYDELIFQMSLALNKWASDKIAAEAKVKADEAAKIAKADKIIAKALKASMETPPEDITEADVEIAANAIRPSAVSPIPEVAVL